MTWKERLVVPLQKYLGSRDKADRILSVLDDPLSEFITSHTEEAVAEARLDEVDKAENAWARSGRTYDVTTYFDDRRRKIEAET